MIKKTFTLARGPKAFVLATLIAVTGMHSVQAMQPIQVQATELNQTQQRAKQELFSAVETILITSSSDQKALGKALKVAYNKLEAFAKAVLPERCKDLMAKVVLDRLEKNITSKLNNILMSLTTKRENTDWATKAIAKHKEMLLKLDNNTLADGLGTKIALGLKNLFGKKEVTAKVNTEVTPAPKPETPVVKTNVVTPAPQVNVQPANTDVENVFLTEDEEDALAGWAPKQKIETVKTDGFFKRLWNRIKEVEGKEETGVDFFGYAEETPKVTTKSTPKEDAPKVENSFKLVTKDKIITMTEQEFSKQLSKERQRGTLKGFVIGGVGIISLGIGFIILESGALDSLLGIATGPIGG